MADPLTPEEEARLRSVLGFSRPVDPAWEDTDNRCVGRCEHANHGPFFCDVLVGGTFEPEYCECPPDRTMWTLILDYSARLLDAERTTVPAPVPPDLIAAAQAVVDVTEAYRGHRFALPSAVWARVDALRAALSDRDAEPVSRDLTAFGKRLAAEGYGWEAIVTREGPDGEETVAHLTTANPEWPVSRDPLRLDPEDPESMAAVLRRVFATKKREWARSPEAGADSDDVLVCDALDDTLAASLNAIARRRAAPLRLDPEDPESMAIHLAIDDTPIHLVCGVCGRSEADDIHGMHDWGHDFIAAGREPGACDRPPEGWFCTRDAGHEGPCAARAFAAPDPTEETR